MGSGTWAMQSKREKCTFMHTFKKKKKKIKVFKNNFNLVYIQVKVIFVIIKKITFDGKVGKILITIK